MSGIESGDIVNVTIKGVRVDDKHPDGTVTVIAEHSDGMVAHWQMPPQAAVERVAPALWPPCHGDLWRDDAGVLWLACQDDPDIDQVYLVSASGKRTSNPDDLLKTGSVELVHSEPDRPPF